MSASTTIDRSRMTFFLRQQTLGRAFAISGGLCAFLPVCALLCYLAGALAFVGCYLLVLLMFLISWGFIVGGGFAVIGGLGMAKEKNQTGCGVCFLGGILVVVGFMARQWLEGCYTPVMEASIPAATACFEFANVVVLKQLFVAFKVYSWSWTVLAAELTAAVLTLVVLAALRLESGLKYALWRVGYQCPICSPEAQLPHFRCQKCHTLVTDLRPTWYGVWRARCGACGCRLPTTDLGGRLQLEKACSQCGAALTHEALGSLGEYRLAMVGAGSAGKTALMLSMVWQLEEDFAPGHGLKLAFANAAEEQRYRAAVRQIERGQVPGKTGAATVPQAFNVSLRRRRGDGTLLYLYDAAGKSFEEGVVGLSGHSFHRRIDGVILVLDPFAEPHWHARVRPFESGRINPAAVGVTEILGHLLGFWERCLHIPSNARFPFPLAVVVTKMDACGLERELGGMDEVAGFRGSIAATAERATRGSAHVRAFLDAAGLTNFLGVVEERFAGVRYFGVTALGRLPDAHDTSPFHPRGVLGPLVWLCHESHALTDASSVWRGVRHFLSFSRGCLWGREGVWARLVASSSVLAFSAAAACGLWLLGGWRLCGLTGALALGVAVVVAYRSR